MWNLFLTRPRELPSHRHISRLNPAGRRRMTSCNVKMSTSIDMPYWNVPFTLESSRERWRSE
jgi:hypothetical protein